MKENKECKIVQDLLPNYIENLTNEETNKFVEEHLKTCENCKKIYDSMKKDLNTENKTKEKKKVKFLKKYRNKLRVLEIIILIIVVVFIANAERKMYIITDLNNRAEEYTNSTNYHKITYYLNKGDYTKLEVFKLDDKQKVISTNLTDKGEKQVITMYGTETETSPDISNVEANPPIENYKQNIYLETGTEKKTIQNIEVGMSVGPQEAFFGIDNIKDLIITAITTSISKTTYDGNECYYVSGMPSILTNSSMYIDKNTGLIICTMASEIKDVDGNIQRESGAEYKYEFGTVTEDDFIEPDISEYKIEDAKDYINQ